MSRIIAVDFDGTIVADAYPKIGYPILKTIEFIKERQAKGDKIILNTCRTGERLQDAVEYCHTKLGIEFDAVNENLPERIKQFGGDSRKISADFYIDDKNVAVEDLDLLMLVVDQNMEYKTSEV
ncbi:MAG: hypothetical protein FWD76_03770 [Firmicutes bacterium]|nr:hypothetical protein [Bacillota bacterium]